MGFMTRLCFLVALAWVLTPSVGFPMTWGDVLEPAPGAPNVIGSYTAGCVQGAISLPADGRGYQVMRPQRRRFFGHPLLVQYLHELGAAVDQKGLGMLLIGDSGQPRGGPMPFGHRSHQNGLDADIWFWLPGDGMVLSVAERETIGAPSMLTAGGRALEAQQWSAEAGGSTAAGGQFRCGGPNLRQPGHQEGACANSSLGCPGCKSCVPGGGMTITFMCGCAVRWGRPHARIRTHSPPAVAVVLSLPGGSPKKRANPSHRWMPTKVPLPAACEALLRQSR